MKGFYLLILIQLFSLNLFSQAKVRESDILYQKRIVRSIPLACIENQKLFGQENQLVQILMEAYKKGDLQGYKDSECQDSLSWDNCFAKLQYKSEVDSLVDIDLKALNIVELDEDLIVDKNRSDIVFEPKYLTILIPATLNPRGILEPLVIFPFDDCIKVFRSEPNAISKNPLKNGRNINYTEVFIMHLYSSSIVKMGTACDLYYDQRANNYLQSFLLGKKEEEELTAFLYKLFNPE